MIEKAWSMMHDAGARCGVRFKTVVASKNPVSAD